MRTLSTFLECFQVRRLKPALKPFLRGETYPYFDASEDSFALNWWTTFEMRHILNQPAVIPHVMQYIYHRMEATFDGRPTLVLEDEFEALHRHPIMVAQTGDLLKRKAKKNVSVGLAWQEIVDASASPLWQAIQASCDTDIYVPNDKALNEDVQVHYRKMGLRPGEIAAIAMARPFSDYLYKTKEGTRLYQLRLSPLQRASACSEYTGRDCRHAGSWSGRHGRNPSVPAWLGGSRAFARRPISLNSTMPTRRRKGAPLL